MSVGDLLADLKARKVEVRLAKDGVLEYRAPLDVVDHAAQLLREHKLELLAALRREATRESELAAQQALEAAYAAWREHVGGCAGCDLADRRQRCGVGRQLAERYQQAWREVCIVPFSRGAGT